MSIGSHYLGLDSDRSKMLSVPIAHYMINGDVKRYCSFPQVLLSLVQLTHARWEPGAIPLLGNYFFIDGYS